MLQRPPQPRTRVAPLVQVAAYAAIAVGLFVALFGAPWRESLFPYRIDTAVYREGALAVAQGGDLYGPLPGLDLVFTYPPFAALVFQPLGWVPLPLATVLMSAASAAALLVGVKVCSQATVRPAQLPLVLAVALWLFPVMQTFGYGQINLVLFAIIVLDLIALRNSRWQGILLGLAIAIKLTPLVFLGAFLVWRRWRALSLAVGSAAAATLLSGLVFPGSLARYFGWALLDTSRVGPTHITTNQSLTGLLARAEIGPQGVWVALATATVLVGLLVAWRLRGTADVIAVVSLFGIIGLLISPISWTHHWVWCIPALITCASWWRRGIGRAPALMGLVGLVIFLVNPAREWAPFGEGSAAPWWAQILGSSMALWGIAFIALAYCVSRIRHRPAQFRLPSLVKDHA